MITKLIELSCDHDGCDAVYIATDPEVVSLRLTRIGSLVAGWTRRRGQDYCPDHTPPIVTRVRELASQRLTDGEIAARIGKTRAAVQDIRRRHNIPPGLGRVGRPATIGSRGHKP